MRYPRLRVLQTARQMVDTFRGYNHNLRIGDGEFFDMKNMTSDYYPVLAPRGTRATYRHGLSPNGLIAKDVLCYVEGQENPITKEVLCYVDGTDFVAGDERVNMGLTEEPKQLVSMGAYVIILPDKKYINTMELADYGSIEASSTVLKPEFSLCTISGDAYEGATVSPTAPANPENLDLWIDTSSTPHTLKKYSNTSEMWVAIATTYVKISAKNIGNDLKQYDGVNITGIKTDELKHLNGSHVLWGCDTDYIIIAGMLDEVATDTGMVKVTRSMPNMDYVIESGNRLWGCRYGTAENGEMVNEIYASKLGDFKNWNCFMGLSTDSYAASCGTDGQFTGAITHLGYPLFFKENCVHKVYGNYPANFQIQATACRGVQKGSSRSLAIVNETLFYKSGSAVCAYDGSLPVEVSYELGNEAYSEAVAGSYGNKYYISMKDTAGSHHLFVYDVAKGMWHKEDDFHADYFCAFMGELYAIEHPTMGKPKGIIAMHSTGDSSEEKVSWMAQTGTIGTSIPDMKYISKLTVRMSMALGTRVRFLIQYDSMGGWEHLCTMSGTNLRSFSVSIRPRRCDHMRLRIEGEGDARIYSISRTIEQGSDIS